MAYLPDIPQRETQSLTTTTFYGLNRAMVASEGELEDMRNMTSDHYPVLSTRVHRVTPAWPGVEGGGKVTFDNPQGMLGTDRLIVCDGGKVYVDGVEVPGIGLSTEAAMEPKHLVAMGAYVCIWPDKKYINLANPDDYGDMGAKWAPEEGDVVTAMMCRLDGRSYDDEEITSSDTAPTDPEDQALWVDTSGDTDVLKQYSAMQAQWVQVLTSYIKIQATGIGKDFKQDDVIFLSGVAEAGETGEEGAAAIAGDGETLSFTAEEFILSSSFYTTHMGGTSYVSTTPSVEERTKVIRVEGIPDGAVVTQAVLRFNASSPRYGYKLLSVNGQSAKIGDNELPVEVSGNGEVFVKFRFQSGNSATVSGSHSGDVKFSGITLEVTYATTASTEEQIRKQLEALNTTNALYGCGEDYIIVAGLLRRSVTLAGTIAAELKIPDLDYVTESNNRLWGCSYSRADGQLTNEIRACALGDFRNWYKFPGTSMDSYVVSIGSDGKFTGAVTLRGQPIFFKESYLHRISGTGPSSFTLNTTICRGVQEGCWRSLAMVGEVLLYKARMDVMAYDGTIPYPIGEKLGRTRWYEAAGAAHMDKYYLSMRDEQMQWTLYVYDTRKGLWHREDDIEVRHMASAAGDLYMIREDVETPQLLCTGAQSGEKEGLFDWMVKFGVFGVTEPQQKYVSRFSIRAQLAAGSRMTLYIQYDSDGVWHDMGTARTPFLRTFLLPVAPRRCDHCQVMLKGRGDAKIYSVERTYDIGGDGHYGGISRSANA